MLAYHMTAVHSCVLRQALFSVAWHRVHCLAQSTYSSPYLTHPEVQTISLLPLRLEPGSAVSQPDTLAA